jgi:hypothetical protein
MEITPSYKTTARRDLTVVDSIINQKLYVLPNNRCKTGTPLTYEPGGWRRVRPGDTPMFFASQPTDGGESIMAFKAGTVETHVMDMEVGNVRISDGSEEGGLHFVNDPDGPYLAITKSRVFLG